MVSSFKLPAPSQQRYAQSWPHPVIANGKVFVGTNNANGYIKRYPSKVDLGCLLCFDEATGKRVKIFKPPVGNFFGIVAGRLALNVGFSVAAMSCLDPDIAAVQGEVTAVDNLGKRGEVAHVFPDRNKVIVESSEGINVAKKHQKPTRATMQGGIQDKAMPIHVSNLMLVC